MALTVTGDIKNNIRKVQLCLRKVSYDKDIDTKSMIGGEPHEHMKIYHHLFADYSLGIAKLITDLGVELVAKNDLKFMEGVYKTLREIFSYKPPITREQFFSSSFAERKIIMTTEIAELVYRKHRSMPQAGKSTTAGNLSKKTASRSNLRLHDFDNSNASKLTVAPVDMSIASVDLSIASVKRHNNASTHSYSSTRSNSGPCRRGGNSKDAPKVTATKRTSSGYTDISPAEKTSPGDLDVSAITCNLGSDSPDQGARKFIANEDTSYLFTEPIDIVAMTPQAHDDLAGNHCLTNKKRREVLHCRDVRTGEDVRLISSPVVCHDLTEQAVRSMVEESAHQVESRVRAALQLELDNIKARVLLLETKMAIMQMAYENSLVDKGEGVAGTLTRFETRSSQESPCSPARKVLYQGNVQSPIVIVGKEINVAEHLMSPNVNGFEDKENEGESESDVSSNNRSSTPQKPTLEEALQNAVTSLVDDVMGGAKLDMSDMDMDYVRSPSAAQAERIFGMIRDTNAVMNSETH